MRTERVTGAVCLIWLATAMAGVFAQTNTGEISGLVVDTSGGVLPGATVRASHPTSGFAIERVTDAEGRFFLPALQTGNWDVTAELPGFRRATQTGVVLELGRTIQLEFTLSLGAMSEEVKRDRCPMSAGSEPATTSICSTASK